MRAGFIISTLALGLGLASAVAAAGQPAMKSIDWSFNGVLGTFDRAAQQRGYQVYSQVCTACHSMSLMYYRDLSGIGLGEGAIKEIAAGVEVTDGPNDEGAMYQRPGRPSDHFKAPFPNENAARAANNGAYPPDLSLIIKARDGGADYVYSLLTGFTDPPPADVKLMPGMNYNAAFPGHQIAMAPPLADGSVEYADGTQATVDQMARDVTTFLAWASEPELEVRKRLGIKVILFLIVMTGMLYLVKRKVWSGIH
jgi:ubiquinol-cytochrome c reductase cytochrome c1 subunit